MASKTQIANLALNLLGEAPIISLTEDVKGARVMNLLFDISRDAVLRLHPWNFAIRRVVLAQKVQAPAFGFSKCFALPSDYLRLVRLNDGKEPYQIEADGLVSNVDQARLRYVARITDTARFDALFVMALAAFLAVEGAIPITNSQSLKEQAAAEFQLKLQEARSVDGMENFPEVFTADAFLEAFVGGEETFRPIEQLNP
jgi:hypothetical protein